MDYIRKVVQIIPLPENTQAQYRRARGKNAVAFALVNVWWKAFQTWEETPPVLRYQELISIDFQTPDSGTPLLSDGPRVPEQDGDFQSEGTDAGPL